MAFDWATTPGDAVFGSPIDPGGPSGSAIEHNELVGVTASQHHTRPTTATEAVEGIGEVATQAETDAGLLDDKIITPLKLTNFAGLSGGGDYAGRFEQASIGTGDITLNKWGWWWDTINSKLYTVRNRAGTLYAIEANPL